MLRELTKAIIAILAGLLVGYVVRDRWTPAARSDQPSIAGAGLVSPPPAPSSQQEDPIAPLSGDLKEIKEQVRAQAALLEQQGRLLSELTGVQRSQTEARLDVCRRVQENLRKQLEGCLFARADLERTQPAVPQPVEPGTMRVEETVEHPAGANANEKKK